MARRHTVYLSGERGHTRMQRVVSITLDGNVYQLEERGYNALFAYLDAMETQLKDDPNRAQTLAGIERAVAEKCQACIEPHKNAVTATEIDRIVSEMAPIHDQPASSAASQSASPTSGGAGSTGTTAHEKAPDAKTPGDNARSDTYPHRRLYQIREGGMIGGVCLGLATFFGVDVTIIRVLFALFAVTTGGWGIAAYVALMFILPRATTREQALSATYAAGPAAPHSWPWDRDGWPWERDGWPWDRPGGPWHHAGWGHDRAQRRAWRHERRMARWRDGRSPVFRVIVIVFFVMLAFAWLSFWTNGSAVGWPFFWDGPFFWGGPYFWGFPNWFGFLLFFVFLRFLFGRHRI
jgi:phage shock protein PspC (stress-responsive transcriptional regulator)